MVEQIIVGFLLFLSFISISIIIERVLFFWNLNIGDFKSKKELEILLSKNLTLVATIGSNAPYIGLLGTVISIIMTFETIGKMGLSSSAEIMSSLGLALKATALGILVAIPSVVAYNLLLRRVEVFLSEWDILDEKNRLN